MRNILSYLLFAGGIFLVYASIMMMIEMNQYNGQYKNPNFIHNASAALNFYQSTDGESYQNSLWSSEKFPREEVFKKVTITSGPPGAALLITPTVINNIVRDSH